MAANGLATRCCIVGGGPAGMMLGVLLARAGVDVIVLEKYKDFFRDFRGDTVHPSTLQVLYELGWLEDFLKIPHDEMTTVGANVAGRLITVADFTHLPTHSKFVAFMPQWDFLNFLAEHGKRYPSFRLLTETEGTDLIRTGDRVSGVTAKGPDGEFMIHAELVVGTDGRHSTIRAAAGFEVENLGAPMDVLWMRIPKEPTDPVQPLGTLNDGRLLVLIDRTSYWQCAFIIPKGTFERLKANGLQTLHDEIGQAVPVLRERCKLIDDWSKVSLLEVRVDRLNLWHRPGVLCIGDAAHAMSPIGGVGINLAVADAVASANILAQPLAGGTVSDEVLARIQARRMFPTKVIQGMQLFIQERAIEPVLQGKVVERPPFPFLLFDHLPYLRRLPALAIGLGVRPEHVRTKDAYS